MAVGLFSKTDNFQEKAARSTLLLGALLVSVQAADWFLTAAGISRYGVSAEGNPILRELMIRFGHLETLTAAKIAAIFLIAFLTYLASKQPWVNKALGAIACIYIFTAIIPWTYVLFGTFQ